IVRVIHLSGQRHDAFQELISTGNAKHWFKVKKGPRSIEVQLEQLQLLRDVRTRWDSVYYMLRRLRELRPVVDIFLGHPPNEELAMHKLTSMEWSVPHKVQQMMSGESTPILSGVIPLFELFMSSWEKLARDHLRLKGIIQIGLDWASGYYKCMDCTRAYIIAMMINPVIRLSWIKKHWDPE
ncbi:hypothetical protein M405DRAFT_712174, partial [Rhizopogon salebrosus TDB-379]